MLVGGSRRARDRRGTRPWRGAGALLVAGVLVLTLVPGAASASRGLEGGAVRILLVGDSLTQGSTGDWTWRYRLGEHLAATASTPVDFVGPRDDLWDLRTDGPGNQEYADPEFDREHAARWGQAMAEANQHLHQTVTEARPDVVVAALGTNDLIWWGGPDALWPRLETFVSEVDSAAPGADVVVMTVPNEGIPGALTWNERLRADAHSLGDEDGRVVVADTRGFDSGAHTWDGGHPHAAGELHLAAAVADALHGLGIGERAPRPIPEVALGPSRPAADVVATAGDESALLRWEPPPGATSHRVWVAAPGDGWQVAGTTEGRSWWFEDLENGSSYSFRVQSAKGSALSPLFSQAVAVVPRPRPPARVVDVRADPGDHAATVSWAALPAATSYVVEARQAVGGDHAYSVSVGATSAGSGSRQWAVIGELLAGVRYAVTVRAIDRGAVGPASVAAPVTPGGPHPVPPRVSPRAGADGGWSLTWRPDPVATSYEVRYRVADGPRRVVAEVATGRWTARRRLPPGTLVRAQVRGRHQGLVGAWSDVVRVRTPALDAVRSVRARRDGASVVVRGRPVAGAASYRLLVDGETGCAPGGWRSGTTVRAARRLPVVRIRLPRSADGRWVLLRAERQRVPGRVRAASAVCVR